MRKKLLIWLVAICMFISFGYPAYGAEADPTDMESNIAVRIENIVSAAYSDMPGQYEISNAITIYNADVSCIYYIIPVFCNQECVGSVEVGATGGMSLSHDSTLYTSIIELPSDDCLLYTSGGIVYAEFSGELYELYDTGFDSALNNKFLSLSYAEKAAEIDDFLEAAELTFDISAVVEAAVMPCIADPGISTFVLPPFTVVTLNCDITDFVTQNEYNICWAACIATISNYRTGSHYTAEQIATTMNHPYTYEYYPGATTDEMVSALDYYDLDYTCTESKLSWSSTKSCLQQDRPFIICLLRQGSGHAVTAYGHSCLINDSDTYSYMRYITIWDPNNCQRTFEYDANYYSWDGLSYYWTATVYE